MHRPRPDNPDEEHAEAVKEARRFATYLFGSLRSSGGSVSTSVESVKIKPNCEGRRGGGGGGRGGIEEEEEEEEEGIWLKALPDTSTQAFCSDTPPLPTPSCSVCQQHPR